MITVRRVNSDGSFARSMRHWKHHTAQCQHRRLYRLRFGRKRGRIKGRKHWRKISESKPNYS